MICAWKYELKWSVLRAVCCVLYVACCVEVRVWIDLKKLSRLSIWAYHKSKILRVLLPCLAMAFCLLLCSRPAYGNTIVSNSTGYSVPMSLLVGCDSCIHKTCESVWLLIETYFNLCSAGVLSGDHWARGGRDGLDGACIRPAARVHVRGRRRSQHAVHHQRQRFLVDAHEAAIWSFRALRCSTSSSSMRLLRCAFWEYYPRKPSRDYILVHKNVEVKIIKGECSLKTFYGIYCNVSFRLEFYISGYFWLNVWRKIHFSVRTPIGFVVVQKLTPVCPLTNLTISTSDLHTSELLQLCDCQLLEYQMYSSRYSVVCTV